MATTGTTKAHGQKHQLDKFYTKPHVAQQCIAQLNLQRYSRIIEPSAGNGAFSNHLHTHPNLNILAFDLAPEHPTITQQNWLHYNTTTPTPTLVIGNPPFGQQCNLAIQFINHAFTAVEAQTVAFILPRSFRKASIQNRIYPYAHLTAETILNPDSFELDGNPYRLNTVFQIWERKTTKRPTTPPPTSSQHFTFTKKDQPHHFAIRRVGGKAGHAFHDNHNTSEQSNYFIKLTNTALQHTTVTDTINMVNNIDFSIADNGTGPRTLAKGELIQLFDNAWKQQHPNP